MHSEHDKRYERQPNGVRNLTAWFLPVAAAASLLLGSAGRSDGSEVKDAARLFQADTVQKANDLIKEIQQRHGKDLLIETFSTVADGKEAEAKSADAKVRDRFFAEWAVRQARAARVNGVYVLICKEPSYLKVVVGSETRKKAFPDADRDKLGTMLLDSFRQKEFNQGLLQGVAFVQDRLEANLGKGSPSAAGQADSWLTGGRSDPAAKSAGDNSQTAQPDGELFAGLGGWLCIGLAALAGVWLVIALVRAFAGGGGGFLTGLLGGLFGAVAGMWIYDTLFGGGSGQAQAATDAGGADSGAEPDYAAGGGGDWGGGVDGGEF